MITRARLLEERSFALDVPAVPGARPGVRWPGSFRAVYDPERRAYEFVLADF